MPEAQEVHRLLVRRAGEESGEGLGEEAVRLGAEGEEGHAGVEFQAVHMAENVLNRPAPHVQDEGGALAQAWAEEGVGEVTAGLVNGVEGEAPRHRAAAESADLGKDEPHPVGILAPSRQLAKHLGVDGLLGGHEVGEFVWMV